MYKIDIRGKTSKKIKKLQKRNISQYDAIFRKAQEIQLDPHRYKNLNYPLNHLRRVHIDKHFVLVFP